MKRFDKMQQDCKRDGIVHIDSVDGVTEVCGCNHDRRCNTDQCPSLNYWGGDKQVGWHEERALEQTGLTEQYESEMAEVV